jgi:gliding motility-associated-like protein
MILNQSYQPVSYTWYLNNELIETEIDSIFSTGLCPGTYRCVVKNSIGCNKTFNISIDPILANLNDKIDCSDNDFNSIKSNASGGTEPYLYLWNTGETNQEINNINPQKYTVQITDNNNCVMIDEITVPTLNDSCLYNTFSPNGDNINDQWIVNSSFLQQDSKLSIFNRWGKKIYKSETSPHIFEGLSNTGKKLSEGTYFYIIESENIDPIKGTITLYR